MPKLESPESQFTWIELEVVTTTSEIQYGGVESQTDKSIINSRQIRKSEVIT